MVSLNVIIDDFDALEPCVNTFNTLPTNSVFVPRRLSPFSALLGINGWSKKNVTQQNGSNTMKNKDNHLKIAVSIAE